MKVNCQHLPTEINWIKQNDIAMTSYNYYTPFKQQALMVARTLMEIMPEPFLTTAYMLKYPQELIEYAFIYFLRVRKHVPILHTNYAVILGCLCIADKFNSDYPMKNINLAQNFNINLAYLNGMEMWICQLMNYHFTVSSSEWYALHQ